MKRPGTHFVRPGRSAAVPADQSPSPNKLKRIVDHQMRDSDGRLRGIFNQSLAGIAQVDLTGRFVEVNARYCEIVGRSAEELRGLHMQEITHADDLPRNLELFVPLVQGDGDAFVIEKRYVRPDGSEVWVNNSVSLVRDRKNKPKNVLALTLDISKRKRAEQVLLRAEKDLRDLLARERDARGEAETLNDVARTLAAELDLETLVQEVTDAATKSTGAQFGAFFYNVTNERGESYLLYTLSGAPRKAFEHFGVPRNTPLFEPTFRGAGVVRLDDVLSDPRYGKNPPHNGMPKGHLPVRSYLAAPVVSRSGTVLGGLFFGHAEVAVFTDRCERLVVGIAAQAAIAIDNAQLFIAAEKEIAERKRAEAALRESHAELRAHSDELERFNRVAVRRELRMIELKQEINELCARLSEDARYTLEGVTAVGASDA
ncbi:MAG: PAS domain S-box protein [Gemmatimonadaceae bacterium]